ncbi:MAG: FAD-dependent oxidoreductase, partial [Saprospiraceae bacterium]|nr:FAD-dependent oxidoreductase [Saprospiraceae bacterium]
MKEIIISEFTTVLGSACVLTRIDVSARSHHIWCLDQPLNALAVVLPRNTEDVSNIMRIGYRHNQTVIVHGGLTNLVGSTETNGEEIVISMEKMNRVEEVDTQSRTMTVQAGVVLEEAQMAAKEKD